MLPILVRPECSSSAVVAAAFHPERASYFLLAFADGTAAVFDAMNFFQTHEQTDHGTKAATSGTGGVLAFIRGLHAQGTFTGMRTLKNSDILNRLDGLDTGTGTVGIGDKSWGITAVAFVPGRKATVITVGADGKCCVVDFTQGSKKKAVLLRTWHLRRPATSLSVVLSSQKTISGQTDGAVDVPSPPAHNAPDEAYYIAIGRQDGRVLLFDLNGKSLGEQTLNDNGTPVIDVEWVQADNDDIPNPRRNSSPATPKVSGENTEKGASAIPGNSTSLASPLQTKASATPSEAGDPDKALFDFSSPLKTRQLSSQQQQLEETATAANHLDLTEPPATSSEEASSSDLIPQFSDLTSTTPFKKTVHRMTVLNAAKKESSTPNNAPVPESTLPPIPPRPSPRPGGLLSMRRAQSSYSSPVDDSYSTFIGNARSVKSNLSSRTRGPFGSRPMRSLGRSSPSYTLTSTDIPSSGQIEYSPSDVPPIPPPHEPKPQYKSPTASVESFQTASSHVHSLGASERSTDTVVDWDVGQTRQPFPSLDEKSQPLRAETVPVQVKNKGHISLSVSSASRDTGAPNSSVLSDNASPIIQWPEESPPYSAPGLHAVHRPTESPARSKAKEKGHVSIPISSASDTTMTSVSPASSGAVVQWPSLKKSPRIPELNKALSFSGRDSARGFVLDTRVGNHSLPKAMGHGSQAIDKTVARSQSSSHSLKIESALNTFRAEMAQRFEEQREWLEDLIKSEDEGRIMLEEENRWLRAELARLKDEEKGQD